MRTVMMIQRTPTGVAEEEDTRSRTLRHSRRQVHVSIDWPIDVASHGGKYATCDPVIVVVAP